MTAMLTDDELDAVLTGAAARLHAATADVAVGAAPSPSFPTTTVLRVAAAIAVIGGTTAGLFAVSRGGDGRGVPVAFTRGEYGAEIVLRSEEDGDGDPNTGRLLLDPGGQAVRVLSGPAAAAYAGDPTLTRCWELASGAGLCDAGERPQLSVPVSRGPDAVALVSGVPTDVAAVAFDAGSVRSWTRPVDGTAAFPYPTDAAAMVTASLVRADGTVVDVLEGGDPTPTETERVTTADDRTLPTTPVLGSGPAGFTGPPATFLRTRGRVGGATGFDGPFLLQEFATGTGGIDGVLTAVTVRAEQAFEARERLTAAHPTASVVAEVANTGVVTYLWAGAAMPADAVLAIMQDLRAGAVPADAVDLDRPYSWVGPSDTSLYRLLGSRALGALLFDDVGVVGVDGRTLAIRAGGDDAGTVQFWLAAPDAPGFDAVGTGTASVPAGFEGRLPAVGEFLDPGLFAVPAETTSLSITLGDGRVVTPELVDVRPTADVKLAVLPASVKDKRIDAVSST